MSQQRKHFTLPHTRLGGTSFLLHANYVEGVRYTAKHCDDVALLLTGVGDNGKWLISEQEIRDIATVLDSEGTTLHVHLPTDGHCSTEQDSKKFYSHVLMSMERVAPLQPHSYVLHLDFPELYNTGLYPTSEQRARTANMLLDIAKHLDDPAKLAIENLEAYPVDFLDPWLEQTPYSRCMDIGHLWKDMHDPLPLLQKWLPQTRLIHLHGLFPDPAKTRTSARNSLPPRPTRQAMRTLFGKHPRDHKSLFYMPKKWLDSVLHALWTYRFQGVVNLEIFDIHDFETSHSLMMQSRSRFEQNTST